MGRRSAILALSGVLALLPADGWPQPAKGPAPGAPIPLEKIGGVLDVVAEIPQAQRQQSPGSPAGARHGWLFINGQLLGRLPLRAQKHFTASTYESRTGATPGALDVPRRSP
jgi:hypothetical protein